MGSPLCPGTAILIRGDTPHANSFAKGYEGAREGTQVHSWMATAELDGLLSAFSTTGGGGDPSNFKGCLWGWLGGVCLHRRPIRVFCHFKCY